jgi:hypothetical protein
MPKKITPYGGIHTQNGIREERIICRTSLQIQILNGSLVREDVMNSPVRL